MACENCEPTNRCSCRVRALGRMEGRFDGREEGRTEGWAESIFLILGSRRISASESVRVRIRECKDSVQLRRWIQRAVHVDCADEIFQDRPRRGPEKWAYEALNGCE
ncbi:hypothetical protein GCM10009550_32800 [Actinocorallia libanotica]|uniref:Uncharacterized protein n=1 Tax=Actinocorallia libanotica TaxID=46162 RepID=A0ABP4BN58_9ACTN